MYKILMMNINLNHMSLSLHTTSFDSKIHTIYFVCMVIMWVYLLFVKIRKVSKGIIG